LQTSAGFITVLYIYSPVVVHLHVFLFDATNDMSLLLWSIM